MAAHKYVEVQIDEARYLADLTGIQYDLKAAMDLSMRLLKNIRFDRMDTDLHEAVSIAILIKYSRPFVTGFRKKLNIRDVRELTPREIEQHEIFIALRNKHIAHSVNAFEENKVVAHYNDEKVYDEGITSISVEQTRLISLSLDEAEAIIGLSQKILDYITVQMELEKAMILDVVRKKPISEIRKCGYSAFIEDMTKIDKRRKK
jgi:hypothetical protein